MKKILMIGEPLIRLMPINYQSIGEGTLTQMYYGGSEINVACNLQGFGVPTKIFTALPNHFVGDSFCQFLKSKGIDTSCIHRLGERVGLYYMENGFGCRGSRIHYDRKDSSLAAIRLEQINMEQLFEDVRHVHFSGITVALGKDVRHWLRCLLDEAKCRGVSISLDLNWRSKLIGLLEAKKYFSEFASYAKYCFGIEPLMVNDYDVSLFNRNTGNLEDVWQRMALLSQKYNFATIFHTKRFIDDKQQNVYEAYAYGQSTNERVLSKQMRTQVLQRVGSGDAFVAGALYQLMQGHALQEVVDFAVACGTLKCTIAGDHMNQSIQQVKQIWHSQQDVLR